MKVTSHRATLLVFLVDTRLDFGCNFDVITILRIILLKFETDSILPPLDDQGCEELLKIIKRIKQMEKSWNF